MAIRRVLFVDHETRLSGGERDLVDLVGALLEADPGLDLHAALPGAGPLADALARLGAEVHVVPITEDFRRLSRWELARRPDRAVRYLGELVGTSQRLARLSRALGIDLIHSNSMKSHLLAIWAARAVGIPHVWHIRDILEASWLQKVFTEAATRTATRVICISEAAAAPFRVTRAEPLVRVVYNGIRPKLVAPHAGTQWRESLGVPPAASLVGMVGQIARWKGQDVFVTAAQRVSAHHPSTRFTVVGECLFPQNEGEYAMHVRAAAEEALGERLAWTGPVEPIEPVMGALDVLVHPSRLPEPFGRVIVEAMAQGTPVVTTAVGAGPELVLPDAGWVVPPDDPAALADQLDHILGDRDELARRGAAARAAAGRFDISATGRGVLSVYAELG